MEKLRVQVMLPKRVGLGFNFPLLNLKLVRWSTKGCHSFGREYRNLGPTSKPNGRLVLTQKSPSSWVKPKFQLLLEAGKVSTPEVVKKLFKKKATGEFKQKGDDNGSGWEKFQQTFRETFLPKGYPNSTGEGYLTYCKYQFVHNVTGTVTGVLSTQSLLYAMGLGVGSIPVAAALNWVIKDGLGQLGGVIYASKMGDRFDSSPKLHRMYSGLAMQLATLLEICTPLFPHLFLPLASISNIGKNISWLASSATRAQMNSSFALRDNLGDITGRSGSQTTAAGLIGTTLGVGLTPFVGSEFSAILLAFFPLSFLSLYSLYRANNAVVTKNLDRQRADLVFHPFLTKTNWSLNNLKLDFHLLRNPNQVAQLETYLSVYRPNNWMEICLDWPMEPLVHTEPDLFHSLSNLNPTTEYLIFPTNSMGKDRFTIYLWFFQNCSPNQVLKGYYHAHLLAHHWKTNSSQGVDKLEAEVQGLVELSFEGILISLQQKGWNLNTNFISNHHHRLHLETM